MGLDLGLLEEFKARLADRYTAAELVEMVDISDEEIIEEYWSRILNARSLLLEEVGLSVEGDVDESE